MAEGPVSVLGRANELAATKFPNSWFSKILMVLSPRLATARSGKPSLLKSLAANATGLLPTANDVSGKVVDVGTPRKELLFVVEFPAVPRLPDNSESVIGKRSPTKNVAGLPSWPRNNTCWPLCTRLSASEKLAAVPGSVSRKVV